MRAFFPDTLLSIAMAIILSPVGCVHEPRVTTTAEKQAQLGKEEETRCQQVAWEAVNSPEIRGRFRPERTTQEPFKFSDKGICCYLDQDTLSTVEVAVPVLSGSQYAGMHAGYLGVVVDRDTYEVLSMREGFWP